MHLDATFKMTQEIRNDLESINSPDVNIILDDEGAIFTFPNGIVGPHFYAVLEMIGGWIKDVKVTRFVFERE